MHTCQWVAARENAEAYHLGNGGWRCRPYATAGRDSAHTPAPAGVTAAAAMVHPPGGPSPTHSALAPSCPPLPTVSEACLSKRPPTACPAAEAAMAQQHSSASPSGYIARLRGAQELWERARAEDRVSAGCLSPAQHPPAPEGARAAWTIYMLRLCCGRDMCCGCSRSLLSSTQQAAHRLQAAGCRLQCTPMCGVCYSTLNPRACCPCPAPGGLGAAAHRAAAGVAGQARAAAARL